MPEQPLKKIELESIIQTKIKKYLESRGWYVVKYIQTTKNGWPDLGAHKGGVAVFIEVKRPGETATPLQRIRHEELRAVGFDVYVADSIESIKEFL